MTKLTFLPVVILSMLSLGLQSQITITNTDLPAAGDTLRYSITGFPVGTDFSATGPNHTWNFSSLSHQSQGVEKYVSVSSVNILLPFLFGLQAFAQKIHSDLPLGQFTSVVPDFYFVYNKTASLYAQEGFSLIFNGLPLPFKYASRDILFKLPLTYPHKDSTTFAGTFALGDTVKIFRSGYRKNVVDGWGIITTPYGQFQTLRVKTTLYEQDSLFWASFPEPISVKRTTIQYKWLAKNTKLPVLEASFLLIEENEMVPLNVRYRDIYRTPPAVTTPVPEFSVVKTELEVNETVVIINQSTPNHFINSYTWDIQPEHFQYLYLTGPTTAQPILRFTKPGVFAISLTAVNQAGSNTLTKSEYITVKSTPSWIDETFGNSFKIKPVLQEDNLTIHGLIHNGELRIIDMAGRIVLSNRVNRIEPISTNIGAVPPGTYIIQFKPSHTNAFYKPSKFIKP